MSDSHPKSLQCVFYSHPWTALLLKYIQKLDFKDSVLVELSTQNVLASTLSINLAKTSSLIEILNQHQTEKKQLFASKKEILSRIGQTVDDFPAPLILAPTKAKASTINQISALLIALNQASSYQQIIVLIHYEEAQAFNNLYDYVDNFHILWDLADLPNRTLTELTDTLFKQQQLTEERWGGFHVCNHPKRPVADQEQRQQFFESVSQAHLLQNENL